MEEVWKDIKDFDGYQVSNLGRVRRLDRTVVFQQTQHGKTCTLTQVRKGKLLSINNSGRYSHVLIKHKNNFLVHRLMAEAFLPNPDNLPCVNHKDENKHNNFIWVNPDGSVDPDKSNLEWCTYKYNVNYGTGIERNIKAQPKTPVIQVSLSGEYITEHESIQEAGRVTDVSVSNICNCCQGKRKTAGGFIWRYKEAS